MAKGRFYDDDFVFISTELADRMPGANLAPGDLVFTHRGSVGQVSMIPWQTRYSRYATSTSQVKARLDFEKVVPEYYYYWFRSPIGQRSLLENVSTVGVPGLAQPVATIKGLLVPQPPMAVQRAIVEVLSALDDKIAANWRKVGLIRQLFDAHYCEAAAAEARPVKLNDVVNFHNRKRVPLSAREREKRPGAVPYYGASGVFGYVDKPLFDEPLVLVGEDGSVITEDGRPVVQYIWGPSWVNNHAHVLTGKGISTELLLAVLNKADVRHLVTGAVQPKISMGKLKTLDLVIPGGAALQELETICAAHMAVLRASVEESRTLTALRDTLLPQLMSGRLRVKDAEKQVEDVV